GVPVLRDVPRGQRRGEPHRPREQEQRDQRQDRQGAAPDPAQLRDDRGVALSRHALSNSGCDVGYDRGAMATTEYESVPAVGADERAPRTGTVVMKFGGTSVGDPEKLKAVARRLVAAREDGRRVVGVLSAMGHTTDELIALAHQVSPDPDPRELDMLVSVGERVSCALAAMAIKDLGHKAISLTGSQAGILADHARTKGQV